MFILCERLLIWKLYESFDSHKALFFIKKGTVVYLQLHTNKEINPVKVVANRTDVATQYNETFLNDNELEELW